MILLAGQIEGISTRRDRSLKIIIGTQELSPKEASELLMLNQTHAFIGIKPEPFQKDEEDLMNSLKADLDTLKTPGQRLRGVLYRLYEKDNLGFHDFNIFYQAKMESIITHFKNQIEC